MTRRPTTCRPGSSRVTSKATTSRSIFRWQVYQRFCGSDLFQDQFVNLDRDFNVIPDSAESGRCPADGLTWTFHIKKGLQWSDGTPVTAHDWVATYQYIADPKHAWDFAWFYAGVLENWDEIIAGEMPITELGVKAVDDLTLQFTTKVPWPALPAMMQFGFVLSKKHMEKYGPLYNSKVETSVSAGPFKLDRLEPGKRIEMVANPNYKGFRPPQLQAARRPVHGHDHGLRRLPEPRDRPGRLRVDRARRTWRSSKRPGAKQELLPGTLATSAPTIC